MKQTVPKILIILMVWIFLIGCVKQDQSRGVYVLMEMSGSFTHGLNKNRAIINHLLKILQYNDTLVVARIDTDGFNENDIVARITFDRRPSVTNNQKIIFHQEVNYFLNNVQVSKNQDLTGGIFHAVKYLNQKKSDKKYILIFSDLDESPTKKPDRNIGFQLQGIRVAAVNVSGPGNESSDNKQYMKHVEEWRNKVHANFGKWKLFNHLENVFKERFWE